MFFLQEVFVMRYVLIFLLCLPLSASGDGFSIWGFRQGMSIQEAREYVASFGSTLTRRDSTQPYTYEFIYKRGLYHVYFYDPPGKLNGVSYSIRSDNELMSLLKMVNEDISENNFQIHRAQVKVRPITNPDGGPDNLGQLKITVLNNPGWFKTYSLFTNDQGNGGGLSVDFKAGQPDPRWD